MPRNRTLACVFAHPDDDAYGAAGSVALHADEPDFRFVLVQATSGEQGDIRDGFPASREALGSVRRAEDEAAWRALGRSPDRQEWLGLPDGGLADLPFEELVSAVARILDVEDPAVVVTFGPDGIFGHPDHISIGAATDETFARLRSRSDSRSGLQRLAHGAVPQTCSNGGIASFDRSGTRLRGRNAKPVHLCSQTSSTVSTEPVQAEQAAR